ncbi:GNAT family N-acetyltransferase [Paenibacillus sp. FJAT-26967]|uniref:GNAT family N-acetyltransferase n=1 Tax=Paenibacillus sp. FJAT-26967 TaxID=1729690 RepID=UPI0008383199|nr:GNAT family N-acetyltransferase [Paenibacillus sp. FJAT-26967]
MLVLKRLRDCSVHQAVEVWNEGFGDYYVPMKLSADAYLSRFVNEGLSADHSLIACEGDRPVGFLLNGIRKAGDRLVSWNGGTAVIPSYRGQRVGSRLLEASLEIYRQEGVSVSTIEAFRENTGAIRLYESLGYRTREVLLQMKFGSNANTSVPEVQTPAGTAPYGIFGDRAWEEQGHPPAGSLERNGRVYTLRRGTARDAAKLPFYPAAEAWQGSWASLTAGESVIVLSDGQPAGYALYKRTFNADGRQTGIVLYQCEAAPSAEDERSILTLLLQAVYANPAGQDLGLARNVSHLRSSGEHLVHLLKQAGFVTTHELVWMTQSL